MLKNRITTEGKRLDKIRQVHCESTRWSYFSGELHKVYFFVGFEYRRNGDLHRLRSRRISCALRLPGFSYLYGIDRPGGFVIIGQKVWRKEIAIGMSVVGWRDLDIALLCQKAIPRVGGISP